MKGETNNKRQAKLLAAVAVMAMVVTTLCVIGPIHEVDAADPDTVTFSIYEGDDGKTYLDITSTETGFTKVTKEYSGGPLIASSEADGKIIVVNMTGGTLTKGLTVIGGDVSATSPATVQVTISGGSINGLWSAYAYGSASPKTFVSQYSETEKTGVPGTFADPVAIAGDVKVTIGGNTTITKTCQPTFGHAGINSYSITINDNVKINCPFYTGGSNGTVGDVDVTINGGYIAYITAMRSKITSLDYDINGGTIDYLTIGADTEGGNNDSRGYMQTAYVTGNVNVSISSDVRITNGIVLGGGILEMPKLLATDSSSSVSDTMNGKLTIDAPGRTINMGLYFTGIGDNASKVAILYEYPTSVIYKDLKTSGTENVMKYWNVDSNGITTIDSKKTIEIVNGAIEFNDGTVFNGTIQNGSNEAAFEGLTAGMDGVTISKGSIVISGTIGGSSAVSITATGDVVFDDASSDVQLNIVPTEDGSNKVIIKDLTLNSGGKLDIQAGAYVEVPENGKLVNNSSTETAISNAGTLVLNTQITTSNSNANASKISNTGIVSVYPGYDTTGISGGTVTSSTSEGDYLGLNKNLDSDYEIKTGAFLEKELTINAGVTLTISSGAFLDLNGKTLTVLGNLVVKNGGYITSGGNTSGNIGTIVLGKTGSIDNSGILGKDANVIITVPADSGRDVYTDGSVILRDVSGIGIGLDKKVNANDVTYTLTLSGDASKKNNVPGTITVTGTVYVDGTLYIGNGITLAGDGTLELKKGATLDLNSKGAVNMNGTIRMNDGSTFNVSGSTTANVSASTGKYVTSQTYTGTKTYTTTVALTNVIGLVITAESNDYYDDVSEKTITEDRLILSGTVKQGSFVSGSNTVDAGVVITKDGTLDMSITSNKMEYGGVYVVDTLFVDKSVKTFTFTETKITVLGTVTYEQYTGTGTGDFADTVEGALIGAMYSVESTDSYGVKTEKYLIKSFDGAFGDIADAVDQTITVYGPVEVSTEIVLGADQTIEGGDFTITVDGKITVDNDANMTVASMDVQGILVDMADGSFTCPSDKFNYSTKSENEAGDITYAGFVVALNNAKPGDVIEISQETKLSSSFTIPAEVTVKVTETGTIRNVTGKVINMTVNGTLINEGTVTINGNTTVNGLVDITEAGSTTLCGAADKAVNVTGEVIASSTVTANINAVWYQNDDGEYVYTTLSKAVTAGSAMDVKPSLTQVGTVSDSTAVDLGDMTLTVTGTAVFGDIAIGKGAVTVTGTGVLTASITGKTGDEGADTATVDLSKAQKVTVSGTSAPNAQNVQVWSVLVSVVDATTSTTLTGAVTVSDGTVRLGSDMTVTGQNSLTVADGAELVIPDGKTLDAQSNSDGKAAVTVNGTMTVNGTLNVNGVMDVYGTLTVANAENHTVTAAVNVNATVTARYVLNIYGTLNVVESEDNGDAQATISGILAVGSKPTTVGAGAGAVAGPVVFGSASTGYLKAYPGADLTAAKIAWNLQNESEAKASVFSINGAEYMTVYAMESTVSFQAVLTDETFELVGYELSYGREGEAGYYDITDADSWKADADLTKDLGTNIGSSDAYIKLNASKVPVVISVGTGISLYIDGIKYTTGNEPHLSVGTHTFTVNVDPGYKGDVTVQFNGQTVTGSFTITPEMASAAYEGTVSVSASGNITQDSTVVVDGGSEDGMGLTDILLIILVVLIVVMAIMVAMRLMRS